jgi:drug/metabolite transporter (DMT)-like permease
MSPLAFALVIVAAAIHATWNLLAKQAAGARHFVWGYSVVAVGVWTPLVLALVPWPAADPRLPVALVGTAVLHTAYSLLLQRGYQLADLSVVYPVVRGTGPLFAFVGSVAVLGERPSALAMAGAVLVVAGVFTVAGGPALWRRGAGRHSPGGGRLGPGVAIGVCTGLLVAAYTVWDGWAVRTLALAPLLVDWVGNLLRLVLLSPRAWAGRAELPGELRRFGRQCVGVGILGPLGYVLVLYAMTLAPVSHVAPARELSMAFGAWLGARVLAEGDPGRRLMGTGLIVVGVVGLAVG